MKIKGLPLMKSKKDNVQVAEGFSFKLPIDDVKESIIVGENNTYKYCFKITPINGSLFSDEKLKEVAEAVEGALSTFEGRQGFFLMSERVDVAKNIESIEKREKELDNEFKLEILEWQKDYLKKRSKNSKSVWNFYYVIEVEEKNINIAENMLDDAYFAIKNELQLQEMYVEKLDEYRYKQLLYEKLNPGISDYEEINKEWDILNIYPENAIREADGKHIKIGDKYYRFLAISYYPKSIDKYRWLKKLFTIKGDVNISIILNPKNKYKITKALSSAYDEAEGKEYSANDIAMKKKYEQEKESASELIEKLASDNSTIFDTCIQISLGASTKEELNALVNQARARVSAARLQSTELIRKDFDPVYNMLPILARNKVTDKFIWNLTSGDIGSIIPFDSSEYMESSGTYVADNETSGGIVVINNQNPIYNNSHLCIIADSGSGKTFFLRCDAIRNIPYYDYTIMFDIKGDLKFPFGKRYDFDAYSGIVVNPFHIRNSIVVNADESINEDIGTCLTQKIMDLIVFFNWIVPEMTKYDESILEEDIRDTYKTCGLDFNSTVLPAKDKFCTMGDLINIMDKKLENSEDAMEKERRLYLRSCIKPYAIGTYSKMFNGQSNWDIDEFTVFGLSNVPEAVQKPLYDILLKDVWAFAKKDGTLKPTRKNIYVDECHEFADPAKPQTLIFLSTKLIKQGRGFGVRVVTATQNLPDLISIPRFGQAIIDNSYFKLFMRLGETDVPVAKKLFNLSPNEVRYISSNARTGNKGRGILFIGSQRLIVQSRASQQELEIIDPVQYEQIYNKKSKYYKGA